MSDLTGEAEKSPITKITLRNQLLTARRSLTADARAAAATHLQDQILALVRREAPATVAAYVPVGAEPGGPDLPEVLAAHARVLLPVLLPDGDLDWAAFAGPLGTGPRGLREPTGPRLGSDAIRAADLVLVPALAVDRRGIRMGRGGGSYDRALARLSAGSAASSAAGSAASSAAGSAASSAAGSADSSATGSADSSALVMALLHEGELLDEVPAEPHDRRVHGVLLPSRSVMLTG